VVRRRKRAEGRAEQQPVVAGELVVRGDQFQAFVDGASADLTCREFELIQLLADSAGLVLPRDQTPQADRGGVSSRARLPCGSTISGMCSACVMAAAAGATGARSGLQVIRHRWLTRRRLRALTVMLMAGAFGVSSVGVSGSTSPVHAPPPTAPATR
jgi:hypothetical protein